MFHGRQKAPAFGQQWLMLISFPLKHPWPLSSNCTNLVVSPAFHGRSSHWNECLLGWDGRLEFRLSTAFLGEGREAERRNNQLDNQTFVLTSLFGLTSCSYLMCSVREGWIFCPNHSVFDVSVTPISFFFFQSTRKLRLKMRGAVNLTFAASIEEICQFKSC